MLTWHPSWPRKKDGKDVETEPELWKETNEWNGGIILWLVSPDRKIREPIPYQGKEGVTTAKRLEETIREILKKHGVEFVEPGK